MNEPLPPWAAPGLTRNARLARRDFLRLLAGLSGGLVVASAAVEAGILGRRAVAARSEPERWIAGDIAPGRAVRFSYPGDDDPAIALALADGTLVGYSSVCTHLGCPVLWNPSAARLDCPCHEGAFDARTGAVAAGPPPRPLPRITLERRAGGVWATGMAGA